jgi:hypothetical protein
MMNTDIGRGHGDGGHASMRKDGDGRRFATAAPCRRAQATRAHLFTVWPSGGPVGPRVVPEAEQPSWPNPAVFLAG